MASTCRVAALIRPNSCCRSYSSDLPPPLPACSVSVYPAAADAAWNQPYRATSDLGETVNGTYGEGGNGTVLVKASWELQGGSAACLCRGWCSEMRCTVAQHAFPVAPPLRTPGSPHPRLLLAPCLPSHAGIPGHHPNLRAGPGCKCGRGRCVLGLYPAFMPHLAPGSCV